MDVTSAEWRKSSYSSPNGGNCVEVAAAWRTSSHSSANGGNCVEVAAGWSTSSHSSGNGGACVEVAQELPGAVAVRDSKDREGPVLTFSPQEWRAFAVGIKAGEFDSR